MNVSWVEPRSVLEHYPPLLRGVLHVVRGADGFSGAAVWRLDAAGVALCLRAWPPDGMTRERLHWLHDLLRRAEHLPFVPRLIATTCGATFVEHAGRFWEVTTWLPGHPVDATAPRLRSACSALAELHGAWAALSSGAAFCPAVERRLTAHAAWLRLVRTGWRLDPPNDDPAAPWARRIGTLLARHADDVPRRLARWQTRMVRVQPCHCDPWRANLLFSDDMLTGLIDHGSAKIDHIAVDLARLLGDLAGTDTARRTEALRAYSEVRPLAEWERELADDLDVTGTLSAAANWLRWLYHERRAYANRAAVAARLAALVERLQAHADVIVRD